ncbi:CBR-GEI-15 protein [Ditylenchus destructor]|nr:CBR-GEI-15 protein [Ditylenchus destructor]
MSERSSIERDDTRFAGYGDRVGSGVELAPARWGGGELVTDPSLVTKSLKPKKFYYSPIGDGVVAADGVEMKRGPPDLTPKVSVIQQRYVEKGDRGQAGKRVVEKMWTSGGGGGSSDFTNVYGNMPKGGDETGRSSRATTAPSPFGALSDPLGLGNTGLGRAPPAANYGSNYGSPVPSTTGPGPSAPAPRPNRIKSPLNGLDDSYSLGSGRHHDYPPSGRSSVQTTTQSLFSEPGYRYEIKKDYKVTNPKELIHQYATTTPVSTIPGFEALPDGGTVTQTIKQSYSSTVEEAFGPFPPYKASSIINPNKFVRQLRDETMTANSRQANLNQNPVVNPKDNNYDHRVEEIRRQTGRQFSSNDPIQSLTERLVTGLQTGRQ